MRVFTTIVGFICGVLFCCGVGATEPPIVDTASDGGTLEAPDEVLDALVAPASSTNAKPKTLSASRNAGAFRFRLSKCAHTAERDAYLEYAHSNLNRCVVDHEAEAVAVEEKGGVLRPVEYGRPLEKSEAALAACVEWLEDASVLAGCKLDVRWTPSRPREGTAEGKAKYKGSLSRREIQAVVKTLLVKIKNCYARQLRPGHNPRGKVVLAWTILESGEVSDAKVAEDTLGDPKVGPCIVNVVKEARFPRTRGGGKVFVNYPFVFSSGPRPRPTR